MKFGYLGVPTDGITFQPLRLGTREKSCPELLDASTNGCVAPVGRKAV